MKRFIACIALASCALGAGCAFEVCCMRPTTGLYDACFAAAAPARASVAASSVDEVPPPAAAPGALRR